MQEVMNEFGGHMRELSMSSHVLSAAIAFCVHKDVPPGESAYSFVSDERIAGLTNELKLPYTDQSARNLCMIYDGIMELRYAKKHDDMIINSRIISPDRNNAYLFE